MTTRQHIRAVLTLPFMATVVVPGGLLYWFGADSLNLRHSHPIASGVLQVVGAVLILLGLTLLIATIRMFASIGQGTLAPWNPTQKLVVQGVYRHVRNPMISGVFFILLGEALGFASLPLLGWAVFFILANMIYMPLFEEPGLAKRFGEDYGEYRQHVPRWLPQRKAWDGNQEKNVDADLSS